MLHIYSIWIFNGIVSCNLHYTMRIAMSAVLTQHIHLLFRCSPFFHSKILVVFQKPIKILLWIRGIYSFTFFFLASYSCSYRLCFYAVTWHNFEFWDNCAFSICSFNYFLIKYHLPTKNIVIYVFISLCLQKIKSVISLKCRNFLKCSWRWIEHILAFQFILSLI